MDAETQLLVGLAALTGLKLSLAYSLTRNVTPERSLEFVGKVSKLTVYPVKSCRGVTTEGADIDEHGLFVIDGVHDRCMMVTREDGVFVTARTYPTLVLISPTIHGDVIHLDAPGMTTLKIPRNIEERETMCRVWNDELPGRDCGQVAADWISQFLQKPGFRLFFTSPSMPKRQIWKMKTILGKISPKGTTIAYHDVGPIHLMSEATVSDLNTRVKTPVSTDNFRPNIVVSGCRPHDEFDWQEFYIGDVKFTTIFDCERCTLPAVDPKTGIADSNIEPTTTLKRLMPYGIRNVGPILGTMIKADTRTARVRVGDPVFVLRKSKITNYIF